MSEENRNLHTEMPAAVDDIAHKSENKSLYEQISAAVDAMVANQSMDRLLKAIDDRRPIPDFYQ